jgi:outer membrane receptor protein involved in Fe transport
MKPFIKILNNSKHLAVMMFILLIATSCVDRLLPISLKNLVPANGQERSFADLTQLLRSVPQVQVTGNRDYARVRIRQNIRNDPAGTPLFIVDGMDMGYDYPQVYRMIHITDVRDVEAVYDASATTTYGSRARNGAIVIHTTL